MSTYRFEDALQKIGVGSQWHVVIFLITALPSFFAGLHNMGTIFLFYAPDHWCSLGSPSDIEKAASNNWTLDRMKQFAIPRLEDQSHKFSKCDIYVRNYSAVFDNPWFEDVYNESFVGARSEKCSSWMYDTSQVSASVITEWDLVCANTAYASMGKSAYMMGMFFGSVGFGYLSDKYGRKRIVLLTLGLYMASALLTTFSPSYPFYFICRLCTGMSAIGFFMCSYIVLNETILPQYRGVLQNFNNVFFSFGIMTLPLIVYFFSDWKRFYLVITLSSFSLFSFYWIFPESPRWLILQGRKEEARKVLRRIANISGQQQLPDDKLMQIISRCHDHMKSEENNEVTKPRCSLIFNLVRSSEMRKITLICCYIWASVSCAFYGISYSSPSLGSDVLIMTFFMGLCDLPSGPLAALVVKFFSRKSSICSTLFLTGVLCFLYSGLPAEYEWLKTVVILLGRIVIAVAFCVLYVMTSELFPTEHRNIAMGISSTTARFGAVIAAFMVDFMCVNYAMIIFGIELVLAGGLCFLLQETGNKSLPDTEQDVQHFEDLELKAGPVHKVHKEETKF